MKRPCVLAVLDEKETEDQICFKDAEIRMVSLDHYLGVQLGDFSSIRNLIVPQLLNSVSRMSRISNCFEF